MAEKMQWNPVQTPPPNPTVGGDANAPVGAAPPPGVSQWAPKVREPWKKRDLIIAIVLFLVLAPLLLVSLGAVAANIMGLASLMDPVANQSATASGVIGMVFAMVVTSAYPFVFAFSLIATFIDRKLSWKTWLVVIAALPMLGILVWLLS